jgi:hypothetical protein
MHGGYPTTGPQRVDANVVGDPIGFHHITIETALEPLVVVRTYGGKGKDIAHFVHDAGSCKGALLIVLLDKLRKFLRVTNLKQVNVFDIP